MDTSQARLVGKGRGALFLSEKSFLVFIMFKIQYIPIAILYNKGNASIFI